MGEKEVICCFAARTGLVIADTMRETFGYTWAFPHASQPWTADCKLLDTHTSEPVLWNLAHSLSSCRVRFASNANSLMMTFPYLPVDTL